MNKILETIYYEQLEKPTKENPLESPKLQKALDSFFNTYFGHFPYDEYDKASIRLLNIISTYQENAFEAGFYAGIELMQNNLK